MVNHKDFMLLEKCERKKKEGADIGEIFKNMDGFRR